MPLVTASSRQHQPIFRLSAANMHESHCSTALCASKKHTNGHVQIGVSEEVQQRSKHQLKIRRLLSGTSEMDLAKPTATERQAALILRWQDHGSHSRRPFPTRRFIAGSSFGLQGLLFVLQVCPDIPCDLTWRLGFLHGGAQSSPTRTWRNSKTCTLR